ncbi:hypothetical protein DLH72_04575 [Candidatus Gracilibacteria bacterium]|nr:MAG: hypothetical protein DLH72_04575 [Candidatus Gracilibacteria bacterium]
MAIRRAKVDKDGNVYFPDRIEEMNMEENVQGKMYSKKNKTVAERKVQDINNIDEEPSELHKLVAQANAKRMYNKELTDEEKSARKSQNNIYTEKGEFEKITIENGIGRYLHNIFQFPVLDLTTDSENKDKKVREKYVAIRPIYDAFYVLVEGRAIYTYNFETGEKVKSEKLEKLFDYMPTLTEDMIIEVTVDVTKIVKYVKEFNMTSFTMRKLVHTMVENSKFVDLEFVPTMALDLRFDRVYKMYDTIYRNGLHWSEVPKNWKYDSFDYIEFKGTEKKFIEKLNSKFYDDLYTTEFQNTIERRNPIGYIVNDVEIDNKRIVKPNYRIFVIQRDYVISKVSDINFNVQPDGKVEVSVNSTTLDEFKDIKAVVGDVKELNKKNIQVSDDVIVSRANGAPHVVASVMEQNGLRDKPFVPDMVYDPKTGMSHIIPDKPTLKKRLEILFNNCQGADDQVVASMTRIVGRRIKDIRELLYVNFYKKEFARNMGFTYQMSDWFKGRLIPLRTNFEKMIRDGFVNINKKAYPYIEDKCKGNYGLFCHHLIWIWSRFFYHLTYMVHNKELFIKLSEKYKDDIDTLNVINIIDELTYADFRFNKYDCRNKLMKLYFNEPEILESIGLSWDKVDAPKLREKLKAYGLSDQDVLDIILTTDNEELGIYMGLRSIFQESCDLDFDKEQMESKYTPIGLMGVLMSHVGVEVERQNLTARITTGDQWTHVQERNMKMMIISSDFLPDNVIAMAKKTYPDAVFIDWRMFYYGKGQDVLRDVCKRENIGSPEDFVTHEMMMLEEEDKSYMEKYMDDPYCVDGEYQPEIMFDSTRIGIIRRDRIEDDKDRADAELERIAGCLAGINMVSIVNEINNAGSRDFSEFDEAIQEAVETSEPVEVVVLKKGKYHNKSKNKRKYKN